MSTTPTGRTRLRVKRRLFRSPVLVLQVEEVETTHHTHWRDERGFFEKRPARWRDARLEDVPVPL